MSDQLIEMSEEDRLEAFTTTKLLNPQSAGYLQREKVFDEKLQEVSRKTQETLNSIEAAGGVARRARTYRFLLMSLIF